MPLLLSLIWVRGDTWGLWKDWNSAPWGCRQEQGRGRSAGGNEENLAGRHTAKHLGCWVG